MNPVREQIARSAAVVALVLGAVLAGVCVPASAETPLNATGTTGTASTVGTSDVGWQ